MDSYQWTGERVQNLIKQKWGVHLGTGRIYQLFHQFGLSHQRVHRDYGPSSPAKRAAFVADLKKKQPNFRRMASSWRWMSSPSSPSRTHTTPGHRRTPRRPCRATNGTVPN
jgi:hypothetical protein